MTITLIILLTLAAICIVLACKLAGSRNPNL